MRDVLYILGNGSTWNNQELRYSLRSVEAYLPHDRVFIVGSCPAWCTANHIPAIDTAPSKLANSVHKLTTALQSGLLADEIVLMNDDFFLLNQCDSIPVAYKGRLKEVISRHPTHRGYYYEAMSRLYRELEAAGYPDPLDYGLHIPFLLNKALAIDVLSSCETMAKDGYLFRTVYGNLMAIGGQKMADVKQRSFRWIQPPDTQTFLSTDEVVVNNRRFQEFMALKFRTPCKYEEPLSKINVSLGDRRVHRAM